MKRIWAVLACMVFLSLSLFVSASSLSTTLYLGDVVFTPYFSTANGNTIGIISSSSNQYSYFYNISNTSNSSFLDIEFDSAPYTFQYGYNYNFKMEFMIQTQYASITAATIYLYGPNSKILASSDCSIKVDGAYSKAVFGFDFTPNETLSLSSISIGFKVTSTGSYPVVISRYIYITGIDDGQQIVDGIVSEDYGYTSPSNPSTDNGLEVGGNLLDEMVSTVDTFNAQIGQNTQTLIDNVNRVKPLVDGVFGIIPMPIQACISGVVVFLVIRKVVGR